MYIYIYTFDLGPIRGRQTAAVNAAAAAASGEPASMLGEIPPGTEKNVTDLLFKWKKRLNPRQANRVLGVEQKLIYSPFAMSFKEGESYKHGAVVKKPTEEELQRRALAAANRARKAELKEKRMLGTRTTGASK